jgi:hypothetical protein
MENFIPFDKEELAKQFLTYFPDRHSEAHKWVSFIKNVNNK